MPQEVTAHKTGNDELDLSLIDKEIVGALICIIAYLILIVSANKDREVILLREKGLKPPGGLTPSELAAISSSLILLASILFRDIAFIRLKEVTSSILSGSTTTSIVPNINIINGYSLTIIGNILKTLGTVQRVEEQQNITIL